MYVAGFDHRARSLFNTYLLDRIEIPKGALIIDCGANVGDFHLALRTFLPHNFRYLGFEPSPHDFASLVVNIGEETESNIFEIALWNEDKVLDFFLDVESASSSLIEPRRSTGVTRVHAHRLDSLLNQEIFLLKVEAEGAEPEVLVGAQKLLARVRYVVVDVGPERGKNEEGTRDAVVEYLESNNFDIVYENHGHRKVVLFNNRDL